MGLQLLDKAWQISDVYHTEKYVLVALAYYADDRTKQAFISYEELSRLTGISARQVKRLVKSLRERQPPLVTPVTDVFSKSLWELHI